MNKYIVTCASNNNSGGLIIDIFIVSNDNKEKTKIGSYTRDYKAFGIQTFYPFLLNGKEYALYSKNYTATRVMSLPNCKDLGGEEPDSIGFCPVEFYVPLKEKQDEPYEHYPFGFVAGCHWGDDSSWKIQYLDLSNVANGIIKREARFGYIELPTGIALENAISINNWSDNDSEPYTINIAATDRYHLKCDYSISRYFGNDTFNNVMQTIKTQGLKTFANIVCDNYEWFSSKQGHVFSNDEQKFYSVCKSLL